jgi:tRNA threonylcarbamoyladenosine biosynthesis protein TsaB
VEPGVIILGVETATQQVGCAIGGVEGVLASFQATRGRRHAETLVPAIEFCCEQARVDLKDVSVVAVDTGPGLFTGLRVGIATAKAMAQALRVQMIGLSSLDLLAFQVRQSPRLIVAAVDARRGELYTAFYRQVPGGVQRVGDYRVCSPTDLSSDLLARGEEALLVGDGVLRYASTFADCSNLEVASVANAFPSAAALVELAQPRALREEFVQPWELEAMYLRKSDAEIAEDGRRQHTGGSL